MDIKNLKTFARVAELKSFTHTAEELNFAQSTVTMQIAQLERELGYPLFDRIGKRISLTSSGQEFLALAYEILHTVEKAENIGKTVENDHGVLRIGVSESLMFTVIMDVLPDFKKQYPNLELKLKTGHSAELTEELRQNMLDMVYISQTPGSVTDLHCHYSRKERLVFVSGAGHPAARAESISVKELMQYDFLVTEHEGICNRILRELEAHSGATLSAVVEVDSVFVITELASRGMGLAFLPEYSVAKHIAEGSLVLLDVDAPPQAYFSEILCHKNRWISPFMADFIETIKTARPERG